MTEDEGDLESIRFGATPFQYPCDESDPGEQVDRDLENAVKAAEWMASLIFAARTNGPKHLNASIGIAILRNELHIKEIAAHYDITNERVMQVVRKIKGKVKGFSISERPDP